MKKENTKKSGAASLSPFDIIKLMYSSFEEFQKLDNATLSRNYFIINERMSIGYPMQAAVLNLNKINNAEVVRLWGNIAHASGSSFAPKFIYTPGKKKASQTSASAGKIPESDIIRYASYRNVSVKDIHFLLDVDFDSISALIKDYNKRLEEREKIEKMSVSGFIKK